MNFDNDLVVGKLRRWEKFLAAYRLPEWDAIPEEASGLSFEEKDLLGSALKLLDETERRIVILHAASGLKHREIAKQLDIPLPTVLSKYARAIKKLKKHMEGDDPNE